MQLLATDCLTPPPAPPLAADDLLREEFEDLLVPRGISQEALALRSRCAVWLRPTAAGQSSVPRLLD
ncbi:MAG TPA: hypothetical protein VFH51_05125 [Myxococcota bacterium]|nr:hypothetical protein [Myxococcota bacterium]